MIIETVTIEFPDDETPPIIILSAYLKRFRDRLVEEGKLIKYSTVTHGRVTAAVRIFRDEQSHKEWHDDPLVQAREALHWDHYRRNNIKVSRTLEPF